MARSSILRRPAVMLVMSPLPRFWPRKSRLKISWPAWICAGLSTAICIRPVYSLLLPRMPSLMLPVRL